MSTNQDIAALREQITHIDEQLAALLAKRVQLARQIGQQKQRTGSPIQDPAREAKVAEDFRGWCAAGGLSPQRGMAMFLPIVAECRRVQASADSSIFADS